MIEKIQEAVKIMLKEKLQISADQNGKLESDFDNVDQRVDRYNDGGYIIIT